VTIAVFVNPGTVPATKAGGKDRSNGRLNTIRSETATPISWSMSFCRGAQRAECLKGSAGPGGVRNLVGRHLRLHRCLEKPSSSARCSATSQLHEHSRRLGVSGAGSQDERSPQADQVYLQDGKDDLNNLHATGRWEIAISRLLCNSRLPLQAGDDDGGHSGKFGGEVFPRRSAGSGQGFSA